MAATNERTVTVFGGTGFLGRRVVRHLRKRGFSVRIVSRHPDRGDRLFALGRRSLQQVKTSNAARQARHVAKLKAAAAAMRRADHRPLVTDSTKPPTITPSGRSLDGHDTVRSFTARVLELVLMTATAEPKTFASATIEADDLHKLADFLRAVADLRKPKLRIVK